MRLLQRAYHFGQRIVRESKQFGKHYKNFGFRIAVTIFVDGLIPPGKSLHYISIIENYVDDYMKSLTKKYADESLPSPANGNHEDDKTIPVWCCWWQGESGMPELVEMCNRRLKQALPENAELHMITMKNYRNYVQIPEHIMKKYRDGLISMTALSDVLRVMLLRKYGGMWIDATVFISGEFPKEFLSGNFYTQKMYDPQKWHREACKGRWCGFLMAGPKEHIIFRYLEEAFIQWWKDFDCVIDYVILDYFLLAAYKTVPVIRQQIDAVPDNNIDIFEMYQVLDKPYTEQLLKRLKKNNVLHKLTYKIELVKTTADGEKTLYGYLLDHVNDLIL